MRWRRAALCLKGMPEIVMAWPQPGYSPQLHAPTPIDSPLGTPEGFGVFDLRPDGGFDYRYETYGWRAG